MLPPIPHPLGMPSLCRPRRPRPPPPQGGTDTDVGLQSSPQDALGSSPTFRVRCLPFLTDDLGRSTIRGEGACGPHTG